MRDGGLIYRCDRCRLFMTSGLPLTGWRCGCVRFPRPGVRPGEIVMTEIYDPSAIPGDPEDTYLSYVGTLAEYLGIVPTEWLLPGVPA